MKLRQILCKDFWGFVFLSSLTQDCLVFLTASSCLMSLKKRKQKGMFTYLFIFVEEEFPYGWRWETLCMDSLRMGNASFFWFSFSLFFFFSFIHLVNLTRITFVTGNVRLCFEWMCDQWNSFKNDQSSWACFALEAPCRDELATKVIKSSQTHFILLTFKTMKKA